jgi:hypothetical protein
MHRNEPESAPEPRATSAYRRLKFIDRIIQSLKPSDTRVQYWDESLPGFGIQSVLRDGNTYSLTER